MNEQDWIIIEQAYQTRRHSTCVRRQVGAVLYNSPMKLVLAGWNAERNELRCDKGECPRGLKSFEEKCSNEPPYDDCVAEHAEAQVLSQYYPGSKMNGITLYVTEEPCPECLEVIDQYPGLRVVVMVAREFTIVEGEEIV